MATRQYVTSIRRILPISLSLLVNGGLFLAFHYLQVSDASSESQIAVELQQQPPKVSTKLPPPPPRIIRIKQRVEKAIEKETTPPPSLQETIKHLIRIPQDIKPIKEEKPEQHPKPAVAKATPIQTAHIPEQQKPADTLPQTSIQQEHHDPTAKQ